MVEMKKNGIKKIMSWNGFLIIVLTSAFIQLLVQNFVFSSSFDITPLRGIDDYVFNQSMHSWQHHLCKAHLSRILNMNDFAYGWIFWALHGLITLPFYLLHCETLIISTARNISLCFAFETLYFLYKILGNYTKNDFYKMIIILSVAFCSSFILFAQSFSNAFQATFFAVLGLYFIIKDNLLSKKTLICSAISLGLAVGTKLTGAFVLPLVYLLLLDRLNFKLSKNNLKKLWNFSWIFVLSAIIFIDPRLLLFFVYREEAKALFSIFYIYMKQNSEIHVVMSEYSKWAFFKQGLCSMFYGFIPFFIFIGLFLIKIVEDLKNKKYDFIYYLITILVTILYLLITIKIGAGYLPKYFITVAIFLPFSFLALERFKKVGYAITIIIFFITFYHGHVKIKDANGAKIRSHFVCYSSIRRLPKTQNAITAYNDLKRLIPYDKNKSLCLLTHYNIITPYSGFRENVYLSIMFNLMPEHFGIADYIILDKNDPAFQSDQKIDKLADKNDILKNKKIISKLLNEGIYDGSRYNLIYEKFNVIAVKKIADEQENK